MIFYPMYLEYVLGNLYSNYMKFASLRLTGDIVALSQYIRSFVVLHLFIWLQKLMSNDYKSIALPLK